MFAGGHTNLPGLCSPPECVAILINFLRNFKNLVKNVFEIINTINESQIKGADQLVDLKKSVYFMSERID